MTMDLAGRGDQLERKFFLLRKEVDHGEEQRQANELQDRVSGGQDFVESEGFEGGSFCRGFRAVADPSQVQVTLVPPPRPL